MFPVEPTSFPFIPESRKTESDDDQSWNKIGKEKHLSVSLESVPGGGVMQPQSEFTVLIPNITRRGIAGAVMKRFLFTIRIDSRYVPSNKIQSILQVSILKGPSR